MTRMSGKNLFLLELLGLVILVNLVMPVPLVTCHLADGEGGIENREAMAWLAMGPSSQTIMATSLKNCACPSLTQIGYSSISLLSFTRT